MNEDPQYFNIALAHDFNGTLESNNHYNAEATNES